MDLFEILKATNIEIQQYSDGENEGMCVHTSDGYDFCFELDENQNFHRVIIYNNDDNQDEPSRIIYAYDL